MLVTCAGCGRFDFLHHDAALIDAPDAPWRCAVHSDCPGAVCNDETGACVPARQCQALLAAHPAIGDGAYTIDPDGGDGALITFCDMTVDGGGWTLVGKVDGLHNMYTTWLIGPINVDDLATPVIAPSSYTCIDAVPLAVHVASEVRLSNEPRTEWMKWPLPAGRRTATFWQHTVGYSAIFASAASLVTVTRSDGTTKDCYQNDYGVLPADLHGGSYPYTAYNDVGNTTGNDHCVSVGVMVTGTQANGFGQNGNGFDAPGNDAAWPNPSLTLPPRLAVWLR